MRPTGEGAVTATMLRARLPRACSRAQNVRVVIFRVVARLGITTALALLGWLFAAALSSAASASTAEPSDTASDRGLGVLGSVTQTTANITGSTLNTVDDTVGTVTNTVDDTVGTVTKTVDDTVGTVSKTVDSTVSTVTKTVDSTVGTVTGTAGKVVDTVAALPAPDDPGTAAPAPEDDGQAPEASAPVKSEPAAKQQEKAKTATEKVAQARAADLREPTTSAGIGVSELRAHTSTDTPHNESAGKNGADTPSAPRLPVAPASGTAAVHAAADSAAGKHPMATLDTLTTGTQLQLLGTTVCRPVFSAGIAAALPCTSPD